VTQEIISRRLARDRVAAVNRRPVTLTMNFLSRKGFTMQPELMAALATLICPEDEECSVHVTEDEQGVGLVILLKVQKSRTVAERWSVSHDPEAGRYTFQTIFQTESSNDIVEELRRILDTPCIPANASGVPSSS
jgi:hypothetical protein